MKEGIVIRLNKKTLERLQNVGQFRDSWSDVINRLLDFYEENIDDVEDEEEDEDE